jgi:hypothetical protein
MLYTHHTKHAIEETNKPALNRSWNHTNAQVKTEYTEFHKKVPCFILSIYWEEKHEYPP